jgi:multidrug efflux pump subunit AcrA (membrane-fusion protein)
VRWAPLLALPPIALGLAAAAWMVASAPGPAQVAGAAPALPVRVLTVAAQEVRPTATAWGNLRAAETWIAVAEVQGEVVWRHPDLEPGRMIAAGTEVLRIDPADYELALAQAEADLAALAAEAAQLDAEEANTGRIVELERERLALAEADLARTRSLAAQGTVPQARADEAERATLLARRTVAELENALALVAPRRARIAAQTARTEAALDRARRALERTALATPFDLRVTEVGAERYQTVAPGQVLIRGDGIAAAEVVAHLPIDSFRRLLGGLPEGMSLARMMRDGPAAQIEVSLGPLSDAGQTWPARVVRIEGALDARARTVPVVVRVEDPYEGADPPRRMPLVPNMQVGLSFAGAPLAGAIAIPETAVHGGMVRLAGADDRLELRPVALGFAQDGRVIVAAGLAPGDRVVLDDIAPAIPGMALAPLEAAE